MAYASESYFLHPYNGDNKMTVEDYQKKVCKILCFDCVMCLVNVSSSSTVSVGQCLFS